MVLLSRALPYFHPWHVIRTYWPLILIFVGAGMIWDRSRRPQNPGDLAPFPVGSTIGTLLFIFVMLLLMARGHAFANREYVAPSTSRNLHTQSVEAKGAKAVKMSVKMPAGEIRMGGGAVHVLEGDFNYGEGWLSPKIDYSVSDGVGELELGQESAGKLMTHSDNTWNLKVNDALPLDLEVDVGAGRGEFRFAKVNLTRLELNIGAGEVDVDLSGERAKDLEVDVHGGVGEANIRLPKNVGVVATVHGGLGSVSTHGLKEEDGQYVNEAYGKSPTTIHLTVNGGIGNIKLQQE
jgi:hypothetical protein